MSEGVGNMDVGERNEITKSIVNSDRLYDIKN